MSIIIEPRKAIPLDSFTITAIAVRAPIKKRTPPARAKVPKASLSLSSYPNALI